MSTIGAWLGNSAWPGNKSCGQFARDVFRLAGAKTDKQKALAFYDWIQRCMMRGANLETPNNAGGYSRCFDPLPLLTSWGFGECTFWGWVCTECLCAAGLKARRAVVHKQGHTYYEVWYKGDDGVEQWHAFDPYIGWYFLNERGEVASCEQLAGNPQLVQNPLPGHPVPLGSHPERSGLGHRHRTEDLVIVDQPIRDEMSSWNLRRGMEVTCNFMPEVPSKALFTRHPAAGEAPANNNPDGTHDDIGEISRLGHRQYAQHMPYWKNYMWPTPNKNMRNEGQPVRWHGAGALRWTPLLSGAEAPSESHYAVFENGCLRPKGSHYFCEVVYHIQVPYLISWLDVDYDVAGGGGDIFSLQVSGDDRRTWWPLKMASTGPGWGQVGNGQAEWKNREPSVQGLNEFWLRVILLSHAEAPTLALQALRIAVGFQHNMFVQPRLVPGANNLWLEAGNVPAGSSLQAEWIYQVNGDEQRSSVNLDKPGRAETTVNLNVDCPSKIFMTGIKLNCK